MPRLSLKLNKEKWIPLIKDLKQDCKYSIFETDTDVVKKALFFFWFFHCNKIYDGCSMSRLLSKCLDNKNIDPMVFYNYLEQSYRQFRKKRRLPIDFEKII